MVFQEIGNGRSKPRITGAIILKSPYYMETILIDTLVVGIETVPSPSGGGHVATISNLARQLLESLTAATASGELPASWGMVAHMSFPDAIQALQQSSSSASESTG